MQGGIPFPNLTGRLRVLGSEGPILSIFLNSKAKLPADGANQAEQLVPPALWDCAGCSCSRFCCPVPYPQHPKISWLGSETKHPSNSDPKRHPLTSHLFSCRSPTRFGPSPSTDAFPQADSGCWCCAPPSPKSDKPQTWGGRIHILHLFQPPCPALWRWKGSELPLPGESPFPYEPQRHKSGAGAF